MEFGTWQLSDFKSLEWLRIFICIYIHTYVDDNTENMHIKYQLEVIQTLGYKNGNTQIFLSCFFETSANI